MEYCKLKIIQYYEYKQLQTVKIVLINDFNNCKLI